MTPAKGPSSVAQYTATHTALPPHLIHSSLTHTMPWLSRIADSPHNVPKRQSRQPKGPSTANTLTGSRYKKVLSTFKFGILSFPGF